MCLKGNQEVHWARQGLPDQWYACNCTVLAFVVSLPPLDVLCVMVLACCWAQVLLLVAASGPTHLLVLALWDCGKVGVVAKGGPLLGSCVLQHASGWSLPSRGLARTWGVLLGMFFKGAGSSFQQPASCRCMFIKAHDLGSAW